MTKRKTFNFDGKTYIETMGRRDALKAGDLIVLTAVDGEPIPITLCRTYGPAWNRCRLAKQAHDGKERIISSLTDEFYIVEEVRNESELHGLDADKIVSSFVADTDMVNHPPHYTQGTVEVIDFIEQVTDAYGGFQGYCVGNALKYLARAPHKGNQKQDIAKAVWYLRRISDE